MAQSGRRPELNLTIYGASDDLVEVEGDIREEFYALTKPLEGATLTLTRYEGEQVEGLHVHVRYEDVGCWSVGVSQLEEGVPLPDWGLSISNDSYTAKLNLSAVPDDVKLVGPSQDDD